MKNRRSNILNHLKAAVKSLIKEALANKFGQGGDLPAAENIANSVWGNVYNVMPKGESDNNVFYRATLSTSSGPVKYLKQDANGRWFYMNPPQKIWRPVDASKVASAVSEDKSSTRALIAMMRGEYKVGQKVKYLSNPTDEFDDGSAPGALWKVGVVKQDYITDFDIKDSKSNKTQYAVLQHHIKPLDGKNIKECDCAPGCDCDKDPMQGDTSDLKTMDTANLGESGDKSSLNKELKDIDAKIKNIYSYVKHGETKSGSYVKDHTEISELIERRKKILAALKGDGIVKEMTSSEYDDGSDNTEKPCRNCRVGKYREMSIFDDADGILHCSNDTCDDWIYRYGKKGGDEKRVWDKKRARENEPTKVSKSSLNKQINYKLSSKESAAAYKSWKDTNPYDVESRSPVHSFVAGYNAGLAAMKPQGSNAVVKEMTSSGAVFSGGPTIQTPYAFSKRGNGSKRAMDATKKAGYTPVKKEY